MMLSLIVLLASISLAQPASTTSTTPISVPTSRQADRVAIITIEGAIDAITAMSVRRRINEAETAGYNAMVFEIDSPGGGVGPVLDITNAIKSSTIPNTIAWVNPDAYSGGAIIALACSEIISSTPASMGDAFPVIMTAVTQGNQTRGGLRGLTADERTKLLPPLLADVTDSARRNGYDEYLVQAIVIDGIELWQIENTNTAKRYAINEAEYRTLFNEDPPRGMPLIAQVTGGRPTGVTNNPTDDSSESQDAENVDDTDDTDGIVETDEEESSSQSETTEQLPAPTDNTAFKPASDTLDDVVREFNAPERVAELSLLAGSTRPNFNNEDPSLYTPIAYITDGSAPIVMREQQLIDLGFSSGIINTDEELKAFMGAKELARANESWSEGLVRVMTSLPVRGVIIAIFLIAVFVELITPGTGIGATVALIAIIALIAPPAMIGLAGWWEIIAIIVGLMLLAIEAFVLPGFGIFGILGVISLFAGILWTFIPAGSSLSNPSTQQDLLGAVVTVMLAGFSAAIVIWFIGRNIERVPLFDKLILSTASGIGAEPRNQSLFSAMATDDRTLRAGETGTATTDLRPAGQADINDTLVDVVAEFGYIEAGTQVRITSVESFRIVVDRVTPDDQTNDQPNNQTDNPNQETA
jgi:membrane-bound serine protease (ClpP class)